MPYRFANMLSMLVLAASPALAGDVIDQAKAVAEPDSETLWYDLGALDVEGRGWTDTKAFFDRLPAKAEGVVRAPVWDLSRNSAGLCARFITDASAILARWTTTSEHLASPHMPATGVSGLDLYVKHEGQWHWLGVGRPDQQQARARLAADLPPGEHEFLLYLPLYNGVSSVELGLPKTAKLSKAGPYGPGERKAIVFYGTSITQGGCASRPGMVHTAILGRRLGFPVINLGFSGNGTMDPEIAALLAELDPAVYVIDCVPNMSVDQVSQRTEPLVMTLRKARPGNAHFIG